MKKEAPAVPAAQPSPVENTAVILPAPETPGTAAPPPAEPAASPVPQAAADKPETRLVAAAPQAGSPAQRSPAQQPETLVPQSAAARAKQHLDRNEFDEAIAAYTEIIRLNPHDPGNADAYYSRGDAYYGKGDIDRASADWNEAIRLNPSGYAPRPGQIPASGAAEAASRGQAAAEKADEAARSNPGYNRAQDALSRLQGAWE